MFSAISSLSTGALWGLVAIAIIGAGLLGLVTNLVLRDRGFGLVFNGILMLFGFVAGIWARFAIFGAL